MSFPIGKPFFKSIVTRSPNPNHGMTFKTSANNVATSSRAFVKKPYFISPSLYPTKPPVRSLALITLTSPVTAQLSISTLPSTLPANAPVAKFDISFVLASSISERV